MFSFYIKDRGQRKANTWFKKQKIYSAQWKYELPGFTILGKRCEWLEEIYKVLLDVPLCITKDKQSMVWTEMPIS